MTTLRLFYNNTFLPAIKYISSMLWLPFAWILSTFIGQIIFVKSLVLIVPFTIVYTIITIFQEIYSFSQHEVLDHSTLLYELAIPYFIKTSAGPLVFVLVCNLLVRKYNSFIYTSDSTFLQRVKTIIAAQLIQAFSIQNIKQLGSFITDVFFKRIGAFNFLFLCVAVVLFKELDTFDMYINELVSGLYNLPIEYTSFFYHKSFFWYNLLFLVIAVFIGFYVVFNTFMRWSYLVNLAKTSWVFISYELNLFKQLKHFFSRQSVSSGRIDPNVVLIKWLFSYFIQLFFVIVYTMVFFVEYYLDQNNAILYSYDLWLIVAVDLFIIKAISPLLLLVIRGTYAFAVNTTKYFHVLPHISIYNADPIAISSIANRIASVLLSTLMVLFTALLILYGYAGYSIDQLLESLYQLPAMLYVFSLPIRGFVDMKSPDLNIPMRLEVISGNMPSFITNFLETFFTWTHPNNSAFPIDLSETYLKRMQTGRYSHLSRIHNCYLRAFTNIFYDKSPDYFIDKLKNRNFIYTFSYKKRFHLFNWEHARSYELTIHRKLRVDSRPALDGGYVYRLPFSWIFYKKIPIINEGVREKGFFDRFGLNNRMENKCLFTPGRFASYGVLGKNPYKFYSYKGESHFDSFMRSYVYNKHEAKLPIYFLDRYTFRKEVLDFKHIDGGIHYRVALPTPRGYPAYVAMGTYGHVLGTHFFKQLGIAKQTIFMTSMTSSKSPVQHSFNMLTNSLVYNEALKVIPNYEQFVMQYTRMTNSWVEACKDLFLNNVFIDPKAVYANFYHWYLGGMNPNVKHFDKIFEVEPDGDVKWQEMINVSGKGRIYIAKALNGLSDLSFLNVVAFLSNYSVYHLVFQFFKISLSVLFLLVVVRLVLNVRYEYLILTIYLASVILYAVVSSAYNPDYMDSSAWVVKLYQPVVRSLKGDVDMLTQFGDYLAPFAYFPKINSTISTYNTYFTETSWLFAHTVFNGSWENPLNWFFANRILSQSNITELYGTVNAPLERFFIAQYANNLEGGMVFQKYNKILPPLVIFKWYGGPASSSFIYKNARITNVTELLNCNTMHVMPTSKIAGKMGILGDHFGKHAVNKLFVSKSATNVIDIHKFKTAFYSKVIFEKLIEPLGALNYETITPNIIAKVTGVADSYVDSSIDLRMYYYVRNGLSVWELGIYYKAVFVNYVYAVLQIALQTVSMLYYNLYPVGLSDMLFVKTLSNYKGVFVVFFLMSLLIIHLVREMFHEFMLGYRESNRLGYLWHKLDNLVYVFFLSTSFVTVGFGSVFGVGFPIFSVLVMSVISAVTLRYFLSSTAGEADYFEDPKTKGIGWYN